MTLLPRERTAGPCVAATHGGGTSIVFMYNRYRLHKTANVGIQHCHLCVSKRAIYHTLTHKKKYMCALHHYMTLQFGFHAKADKSQKENESRALLQVVKKRPTVLLTKANKFDFTWMLPAVRYFHTARIVRNAKKKEKNSPEGPHAAEQHSPDKQRPNLRNDAPRHHRGAAAQGGAPEGDGAHEHPQRDEHRRPRAFHLAVHLEDDQHRLGPWWGMAWHGIEDFGINFLTTSAHAREDGRGESQWRR